MGQGPKSIQEAKLVKNEKKMMIIENITQRENIYLFIYTEGRITSTK